MKGITTMITIALLFMFMACSCDSDSSTTPPPPSGNGLQQTDMDRMYEYVRRYQLAYIRSLQLPSGAIRSYGRLCPYFTNFAAMALLTDPSEENVETVKKYLSWYISRLNGKVTDFNDNEVEGSIYDYTVDDTATEGTYDSVDSYAATFLEVVMRMASISTELKSWCGQYKDKITLVAGAMIETMDTDFVTLPGLVDNNDYLSIAHYGYTVKYLMDNSEVNMGLKAAGWLEDNGLIDNAVLDERFGVHVDIENLIEKNTAGIETLWKIDVYDVAKNVAADWNTFYPGASAQLYPAIFNVIAADGDRALRLYEKFNVTYPDWSTGKTYDAFPWTIVAYAAAAMKDKERVDAYVAHIYDFNIKNEQKAYWYDMEAGCLVLAIDTILNAE